MKICHSVWFNKEADMPIPEQGKSRRKSQTESAGEKKGRVRRSERCRWREKQDGHAILKEGTKPSGKV